MRCWTEQEEELIAHSMPPMCCGVACHALQPFQSSRCLTEDAYSMEDVAAMAFTGARPRLLRGLTLTVGIVDVESISGGA